MRLCYVGKDGGKDSTVWGFWPIEIKSLFSVALLCFEDGSREAYHSHAFNSVSWVLKGKLQEDRIWPDAQGKVFESIDHAPSLRPIFTSRDNMHKVTSRGRSWVLTLRGPWAKTWQEWRPLEGRTVTLTDGRREL